MVGMTKGLWRGGARGNGGLGGLAFFFNKMANNCQRDHGDSLVHPGKSCTLMRSGGAPIEGDLPHHPVELVQDSGAETKPGSHDLHSSRWLGLYLKRKNK